MKYARSAATQALSIPPEADSAPTGISRRRLGLYPLIGCNQTRWSDIGICGGTHPGFLEAMGQRAGVSDRWKIALERAHLERAHTVVAHSALMRDEALRFYGIAPEKIALLYPPIDREKLLGPARSCPR